MATTTSVHELCQSYFIYFKKESFLLYALDQHFNLLFLIFYSSRNRLQLIPVNPLVYQFILPKSRTITYFFRSPRRMGTWKKILFLALYFRSMWQCSMKVSSALEGTNGPIRCKNGHNFQNGSMLTGIRNADLSLLSESRISYFWSKLLSREGMK